MNEKIEIDKYFYYIDGKPLHDSDVLCQKLADVVNKTQKHLTNMTKDELLKYMKPAFIESGVKWLEE